MLYVKNYMEDVVFDFAKTMLPKMDMCQCERCYYDVVTIALNNVKPKYVTTKKGDLYSKITTLQQQFEVDVVTAITNASEIVKKSPRHDE